MTVGGGGGKGFGVILEKRPPPYVSGHPDLCIRVCINPPPDNRTHKTENPMESERAVPTCDVLVF